MVGMDSTCVPPRVGGHSGSFQFGAIVDGAVRNAHHLWMSKCVIPGESLPTSGYRVCICFTKEMPTIDFPKWFQLTFPEGE